MRGFWIGACLAAIIAYTVQVGWGHLHHHHRPPRCKAGASSIVLGQKPHLTLYPPGCRMGR